MNALRLVHGHDLCAGVLLREYETTGGDWSAPDGPAHTIVGMAATPIVTEFKCGAQKLHFSYAPGEGLIIPEGVAHCTSTRNWQRFIHCTLSKDYLQRIAKQTGLTLRLPAQFPDRVVPSSHPVMSLVRLIHNESKSPRPFAPSLGSMARLLAIELLRFEAWSHTMAVASPSYSVRMQRVLQEIHAGEQVTPSQASLAKLARLSEFHFARVFRNATGHSPRQYLIRVRVERAASLIETQGRDANFSVIAHTTGFADQSHFNRHFLKLIGVTPGAYRHNPFPVQLVTSRGAWSGRVSQDPSNKSA